MSRSRPRGFTIFELIIILAIIALLLGLLIPAIQKANEAAARARKTNNLKEIGLATHSYHDVYKVMPAASAKTGMFGASSPQPISVNLLPYVEQLPLAEMILRNNGKAPANVRIRTYNVEKDPSTEDFMRVQNFAANVRVFADGGVNTDWNKTVALKPEMICTTSLGRTFLDGTSNTIGFATRYAAAKKQSAEGKAASPCGYYDLMLTNDGGSFFGATPMVGKVSATTASGWQLMPTLDQVNCSATVGMAHAFEKTGILVALCDASVRFVAPGISSQTWNQALQPNDGNPPGADW